MPIVILPSEITIEKRAQETATLDTVTVRRMVYSGQQTLLVVTDELDTIEVPLTQQQYEGLSATLQAIFAAHLMSLAL